MPNAFPTFVSTIGSDAATRQRVSRAARAGELRQLTPGLYTSRVGEAPADLIRRHAYEIAGLLYPGGVVGYRTALEGGVHTRDALFITHSAASRELPGLTLRTVPGHGPLPDDMRIGERLYLSSVPRFLLENLVPSRSRGAIARAAGPEAVERYLDRRAAIRGVDELQLLRDQARACAAALGLEAQARHLGQIIAGLQGTSPTSAPLTPAGRSRARGEPVDERRLADFEAIAVSLNAHEAPLILQPEFKAPATAADYWRNAAFFESYFSNYIEGTEFDVDEARRIVFDALIPADRPADAHDILGVYAIVADENQAMRVPSSATHLIQQLQEWHHELFQGRPEIHPGQFKSLRNRAGGYAFVLPEQVIGTLKSGFAIGREIRDPLGRAIFMHHLVSEVHPFNDGNGRLSRLFMNTELTSLGITRVVVPTVLRDDYLAAVRLLSREREPRSLQRVLTTCQTLHNATPLTDYRAAVETLARAQAFEHPNNTTRLRMPEAPRPNRSGPTLS